WAEPPWRTSSSTRRRRSGASIWQVSPTVSAAPVRRRGLRVDALSCVQVLTLARSCAIQRRSGAAGTGRAARTTNSRGTHMTDTATGSRDIKSHETTSFADLGKEMWAYLTGKGAAINY